MPTAPLPPTLDELALRIGMESIDLDEADTRDRLQAAIDDATALVLAEVSDALATRWTTACPAVVRIVIFSAARRGFENPRALNQETFGEHMVGMSDTTGVFLTAREALTIRKAATGLKGGYVGSVRTPSAYGVPIEASTAYVPVSDGSAPVPLLDIGQVSA